jgi:hypothetical protein
MQLFNRKSRAQRLLKPVNKSLRVPSGIKSGLPDMGSGKAKKAALITAGGLASLTAGSAGISSLRRRSEGASDDS